LGIGGVKVFGAVQVDTSLFAFVPATTKSLLQYNSTFSLINAIGILTFIFPPDIVCDIRQLLSVIE